VSHESDAHLPQVVLALAAGRGQPGLLHRRQQEADERARDGDDDQKLDEREALDERQSPARAAGERKVREAAAVV
jgi:hypothetical protein